MNKLPVLLNKNVMQLDPNKLNKDIYKGDLILVRSDYDYEKYGDHFSLIVGGKIMKNRGLRPNLVAFSPTTDYKELLDSFTPIENKTILLVYPPQKQEILDYYGVHLSEGDLFSI